MGNNKSTCMPLCGDKDCELPQSRKYGKFKKNTEQKKNLKNLLEQEAFERQEEIRNLSPIDNCFTYLEKQLIHSNSEWATSLLFHYAGKMGELMDHKHKTYNWNIELNLQEEAIRFEALRDCLSDSQKEGDVPMDSNIDLSASDDNHLAGSNPMVISPSGVEDPDDPFNYGAAAIGKDGSMVLMKNSNIFQFSSANLNSNQLLKQRNALNESTNLRATHQEFATSPDTYNTTATRNYLGDNSLKSKDEQTPQRKALSQETQARNHISQATVQNLRFQQLLEQRRSTDLFKRKVQIIKRHFKNTSHPLRMLADLFADELENILKKQVKLRLDDYQSSYGDGLGRSNAKRTILKISERDQEAENLKQLKIKKFQQMTQIVKDFILLLKHSIIRFYQVDYNGLRAFQKNYFSERVKNLVLGYKVSKVLHQAAADAYRDDIIDFAKAMTMMQSFDLEYFQVPPQFHLDEQYYLRELRKKDVPIKVVNHNMEKSAVSFRMQRLQVNKSQLNAPTAEAGNETPQQPQTPLGRRPLQIRLSEKTDRPMAFGGIEFVKEMPPLEIPGTLPPLEEPGVVHNEEAAAPGSHLSESEQKKSDTNSTIYNKKSRESQLQKNITPYLKTTGIIKQVEKVISLKKKRAIFIYAWKKLQKEVNDYWEGKETKVPKHKLILCEDHRLCLMSFVIVQSQCADLYTSFLALNPFIDYNSMEEAVPLATIENSIQVILKDYMDRQNSAEVMSEGPIDQSRPAFDIASQPRLAPSIMSDNMSMRSQNFMQQIDGFKKQIEDLKLRQSNMFHQSMAGVNQGLVLSHIGGGGVPIAQMCDDFEMNQEQEEEELRKRLCMDQNELEDSDEDRIETQKQKEIMKRWQNAAMYQRGTSFKNPRAPPGQGLIGERVTQLSFLSMMRHSQAPNVHGGKQFQPSSSLFLDQPNFREHTQAQRMGPQPLIKQNILNPRGNISGAPMAAPNGRLVTNQGLEFKTPRLSASKNRIGVVDI